MSEGAVLLVEEGRSGQGASYWLHPMESPHMAEERQRLAMGYVGPVIERVFAATKLKYLGLNPGTGHGKGWDQVISDHAGRVLMKSDNAWEALAECCRIYHFGHVLEAAIRDFPDAKAVLTAGYVLARLEFDMLRLEIYLPCGNNTFATWPI